MRHLSPTFSCGGLHNLTLAFFPKGHTNAKDGCCSLFLHGPYEHVKAQLILDGCARTFGKLSCISSGSGWPDFMEKDIDFKTITVQILDYQITSEDGKITVSSSMNIAG
eukprot:TRINITY_DN10876_c0_g1_i4.p1 TRINITY_DN10876_c0_g1~~TRINITY_DN10876_c0_g1_i4.p1  ORF type:complete len:109 (+),score=1.66 TRINITY_DN10876_c0_g1_i4:313-639(+)